ncbi:MAG: hypothetical protein K8I30_13865 [Anaerolineae bacterium]|nr:hypothetical protein [Anaerolineae bacterium]
MFSEERESEVTGLHICPVCTKLFIQQKALYLHIMHVHQDGQRLAFDLRADLYSRWQERVPRVNQ